MPDEQATDERVTMRAALVTRVAAATGYDRYQVNVILSACFAAIAEELARGARVRIDGFGQFHWTRWAGRAFRHPATGILQRIPDRRYITFETSARLREKMERFADGYGRSQQEHDADGSDGGGALADPPGDLRSGE